MTTHTHTHTHTHTTECRVALVRLCVGARVLIVCALCHGGRKRRFKRHRARRDAAQPPMCGERCLCKESAGCAGRSTARAGGRLPVVSAASLLPLRSGGGDLT